MGILAPLFLAGLTALSLPLIFHLVRRTPRGRQEFSSLMFLAPTVPRLTRRSRLDQVLLLLLRLAALALIVLAFSRPFLREAALLSTADLSGKRLAILIDTSASMKRGDLWSQAVKLAEKELDELNPQDDVALFAFSDRLQTVIDFQKEGAAPIADKPQVVRNRLKQLQPEWGATDLGTALVTVAGELDSSTDVRQSSLEPQIVVISDFQSGSRIEALQSFKWPERIAVVTRAVSSSKTTNAHAHLLPNEEGDDAVEVRVRVVNAADSRGDQFTLEWSSLVVPPSGGSDAKDRLKAELRTGQQTPVYVPAGQSRVIRLPRGTDNLQADRIVLRGDDHDFDNTFYVVPPRKLEATVLYAGDDSSDDPQGCSFYLRLAVANDPLRQVEIRPLDDVQRLTLPADSAARMVVVSKGLPDEMLSAIKQFVDRGGLLLLVLIDDETAASFAAFWEDIELDLRTLPVPPEPEKPILTRTADTAVARGAQIGNDKYLLLGDIDFTHPLFAPFASPRYNDFTKIHFWKHRAVRLKTSSGTRVVARFDNGEPAMLERSIGQGRVIALTSGWHPSDSQLALSSKFVPLIGTLLDLACGGTEILESVAVHQPVALASDKNARPIVVTTPDGRDINVASEHGTFEETDMPGLYRVKAGSTETRFAVNLASTESNTTPLNLEQLEQRGVRFGAAQTRTERIEKVRQQRDIELESRQKVWRWLIVVALITLILETWWAGRAERQVIA